MSTFFKYLCFLIWILTTVESILPNVTDSNFAGPFDLSKYIVSIKYKNKEKSYLDDYLCTGAILTSQVVVLVAHCLFLEDVEINSEDLLVTGGFTFGSPFDTDLQSRSVAKTIIHPEFKRDTYEHDVALLTLNASFDLIKDKLQQATIPKHPTSDDMKCEILGFGVLLFQNQKSSQLLKRNVKIWPTNKCTDYLKKHNYHSDKKFCGGQFKTYSPPCKDLASDAMLCNSSVYGLTLFSVGCQLKGYFAAVLIDLSYYKDWITKNTQTQDLFSETDFQNRIVSSNVIIIMFSVLLISFYF